MAIRDIVGCGLGVLFIISLFYYQFIRPTPQCPNCGNDLPKYRVPRRWKEVFWGGWTCSRCKSRVDVNLWGKITSQPPKEDKELDGDRDLFW